MEPQNPLLWLNLGIAQQRTGEYEEAIFSFEKALAIDDEIADAWLSLGLIYYELENFDLAESSYQRSISLEDENPKTWNNLGVLYFTEGDFEEARYCFEQALTLAPLYYEALYNLRDACRELEDYRAAAEFERLILEIKKSKSNNPLGGYF
jgi:tetratricopeptide (TPR) repeat protein